MFNTSKLFLKEEQRDRKPLFELTDDELEKVTGAHGDCSHNHKHHKHHGQQQQQQQQQQAIIFMMH